MAKLVARIDWPAALVFCLGALATAFAYLRSPPEYRAPVLGAVGFAWGCVQAFARGIVRPRRVL